MNATGLILQATARHGLPTHVWGVPREMFVASVLSGLLFGVIVWLVFTDDMPENRPPRRRRKR